MLSDDRPPAISCTQGDIIKIHAYNGLGDHKIGTALHAHGMFFNGTNYYDGAVGVTQCSIPSERGMDYVIDTSLQVSKPGRQAVVLGRDVAVCCSAWQ
jgi:iron transport multicopper oxidase